MNTVGNNLPRFVAPQQARPNQARAPGMNRAGTPVTAFAEGASFEMTKERGLKTLGREKAKKVRLEKMIQPKIEAAKAAK